MRKYAISILLVLSILLVSISTVFASPVEYFGAGYIEAKSSTLGDVKIYLPIDSRGKIGTDSNGYLHSNVSNTISGVMYTSNGTEYLIRFTSFSYPRYQATNSSTFYTGYFTPNDNNLEIATAPVTYTFESVYPFILIGMMGVIIVCLMRSKH